MNLQALTDLTRRAAIYAIPIYETYRARWQETVDPANPRPLALNHLEHAESVAIDTLLSSAWVDLNNGPMFLTVPDMGARSYDFAIVDMFGDTIDHVSRRLYGGRSPPHVLFGPTWTNPPPFGVRAIQATTFLVRLTGRIAVDGVDDVVAARAVQAKVLFETPATRNERRVLEAGELMPSITVPAEEPVASWVEPHTDDPWDLLAVVARVLGEGPLPERDKAEVEAFAALRLRPGRRFDLLGFSRAERAAMLDGIDAARTEVREAVTRAIRHVAGWRYPPIHPGDFGDDRLQRAAVATLDPFMPEAAESVTLVADIDQAGAPLDGTRRYVLRFSAGEAPPTRASWALSVDGQVVALPLSGIDSDVKIVSRRSKLGRFDLALHIREPGAALRDFTWQPPGILRVD